MPSFYFSYSFTSMSQEIFIFLTNLVYAELPRPPQSELWHISIPLILQQKPLK